MGQCRHWRCAMTKASLWCAYLVAAASVSPVGADQPSHKWWNEAWRYRVPVLVKAALGEEKDAPAQVRLNFGAMLKEGETFDPASVRVIEQDSKTGGVIAELPCLYQPLDSHWAGIVPLSWHEPYDGKTPPLIRVSSDNPAFPGSSLLGRGGAWEPSDPNPPWRAAIDLGKVELINAVFVRVAYNGHGISLPTKLLVETATESADGLRQGNWERVGGWENLNPWYVNGFMRPFFFAPRPARYVRLVIEACNRGIPRIAEFSVYPPFHDPVARAEGRVSWFVPGSTGKGERTFFIYFDSQAARKTPPPLPATVAVLREAEEAVNLFSPPGPRFTPAFDPLASGPTTPNMLTYSYPQEVFFPPAGFAVTLPRTDSYSLHLRVRASLRDHAIRLLWDTREIFNGTFSVEGEGWSVVSLPPLELTEGVHYLEVLMKGGSDRPLDLDYVLLTNARQFNLNQGLLAIPGRVEVRS